MEQSRFRDIISAGLQFMHASHVQEKLSLLTSGFFSLELLQALICGGESYRTAPISYIWHRLTANRLFVKSIGYMPGAYLDHQIDAPLLFQHLQDDTFANLFDTPAALIDRYAGSILAIDILKEGIANRGSGFVVHRNSQDLDYVVTCKHNVDPTEHIVIERLSSPDGSKLEVGPWRLHPTFDLATAPLSQVGTAPMFRLIDDAAIFDEVYTLGFPHVPGADAGVVGHRGEVNGIVELYLQKCPAVLISNLVSPGSSGCPVCRPDGHIIGMTMRWLEAGYGEERARFSAALPARQIGDFLDQ